MNGGVLIISHTFPPAPGVGGRRWAKFAKSLSANGHAVRVLSANTSGTGSLWSKDVKNIPLVHWQHFYPEILDKIPASVFDKLHYRAALIRNSYATKGNPYDRSMYDGNSFTNTLTNELTLNSLGAVIISGPPFGLLSYAAALRQRFPATRFLADLRDPWTTGVNYGYSLLTGKRAEYEKKAERSMLQNFDAITTPWPAYAAELKNRYPEYSDKIYLLPHAFDRDDIGTTAPPPANKIPHILYGGNAYSGFDAVFRHLSALASMGRVGVEIYSYSNMPPSISAKAKGFEWSGPIAPRNLFEKVAMADYLLFLIPETLRNGLPTKLYEYVATGRPLLAIGERGTLQELIEKEGLGLFVETNQFAAKAEELLLNRQVPTPKADWAAENELSRVTEYLLHIIKNSND